MNRFVAAAVVWTTIAIPTPADDNNWQPPAPPPGWKAVASKDGAYRFAVPPGTGRSGTRERTLTINRVRVRAQINYYHLKDGTQLEVESAILGGSGVAGTKVSDVIDGVVEGQRDEGFKVSEPKDVMVGTLKAKEYRLTKDKEAQRMVVFFARPRFFALTVAADDPAKLDTDIANNFLTSLVLVPAEVLKTQAKERAAKDEAAGKENLAKYGFKWTTALKDMNPPDAEVTGVVRGKEFKPDTVTIDRGNWLTFRQGKEVFADIEVKIWLLPKAGESVESKTYEIGPAGVKGGSTPHVQIATMGANRRVPQSESFLNRYAMKLTLGAKESDGSIPGTIYLCTPDSGKSFVAGKFTATAK
jgi:hypothetical protein